MNNPILIKLFRIIAFIILSFIPSSLILLGSYLIALGSTNFLSGLMNITIPFGKRLPQPYYVYSGLFLILTALLLVFFLVRKKKDISPFGWIISLLIQAVFTTFLITLFVSPLFHFLTVTIIFKAGFCEWMTKIAEIQVSNKYKPEALENIKQFCTAGSKLFNFTYP